MKFEYEIFNPYVIKLCCSINYLVVEFMKKQESLLFYLKYLAGQSEDWGFYIF